MGKLFYSDEAHQKLNSALTAVESGVTELKNTIGRVGKMQLEIGIKNDYLAGLSGTTEVGGVENDLDGNSRSAVGLRLIPNPDINRFYQVELAQDPRGRRRDKLTVETRTDENTGASTTTSIKQTRFDRDYLISAQAGWALDNVAVRVGLFDSTGGVGADYRLNDRVTVTGEAFDFGKRRDDNPHIRLFGEYTLRKEQKLTPRIFLTTGVDNALNDTAFIVGGGIRWRDEDLKYLLGSIPVGK
jgi:phospholipid/cholesterol/gamma-HCH transport system substrate-binding protein